MNLVERDGWLTVRLQASEKNPAVDWDELVRWKIPESDRVPVPELDAWLVRSEHEDLVKDLYFIYQAASDVEADTQHLAEAQKMIERLDGLKPGDRRKLDAGLDLAWQLDAGMVPRWKGMYQMGVN